MLFCLRLALSAAFALQSSLHVGDLVHAVSAFLNTDLRSHPGRPAVDPGQ